VKAKNGRILNIEDTATAIMGLFSLIPLEMIKSIIRERQQTSEKAKQEIASQMGRKTKSFRAGAEHPVRIFL